MTSEKYFETLEMVDKIREAHDQMSLNVHVIRLAGIGFEEASKKVMCDLMAANMIAYWPHWEYLLRREYGLDKADKRDKTDKPEKKHWWQWRLK